MELSSIMYIKFKFQREEFKIHVAQMTVVTVRMCDIAR